MTTFQKIIKYLAMAFAIFLSVSIISGICGALYSVSYFFSGNTTDEMTEHVIGNNFTSLSVNISAAELEIKTGELNQLYVSGNKVYHTGNKPSNEDVQSNSRRYPSPFFRPIPETATSIASADFPPVTILIQKDLSYPT